MLQMCLMIVLVYGNLVTALLLNRVR